MPDWSERDVIAAADWAQFDLVERIAHQVSTITMMGRHELGNGELLNAAEDGGFDVMVMADQPGRADKAKPPSPRRAQRRAVLRANPFRPLP